MISLRTSDDQQRQVITLFHIAGILLHLGDDGVDHLFGRLVGTTGQQLYDAFAPEQLILLVEGCLICHILPGNMPQIAHQNDAYCTPK